jgi:hypothetical protein
MRGRDETLGVRVEGRTLVYSQTVLIGDNQPALFTANIGQGAVPFEVTFVPAEESNTLWDSRVRPIKITCEGWKSPLGLMIAEPVYMGDVGDGTAFFFQIAQYFMAGGNLVHFFVWVGAK